MEAERRPDQTPEGDHINPPKGTQVNMPQSLDVKIMFGLEKHPCGWSASPGSVNGQEFYVRPLPPK